MLCFKIMNIKKIIKYFIYLSVIITFLASLLAIYCFVFGCLIIKTSDGLPGAAGVILILYGNVVGFLSAIPGIVLSLILKFKYRWNTIISAIFFLFYLLLLIASFVFLYIVNYP